MFNTLFQNYQFTCYFEESDFFLNKIKKANNKDKRKLTNNIFVFFKYNQMKVLHLIKIPIVLVIQNYTKENAITRGLHYEKKKIECRCG